MKTSTTKQARRASRDSEEHRRPDGPAQTPLRRGPLLVALVSSGLVAAGLVCLYLVMRWVGLENGGACASGGPYEIRAGQECEDGVFALAYAGIGVMVAGFLVLLRAAWKYGGSLVVTSACGAGGGGFFAGLGLSFLKVESKLPASATSSGDYRAVGYMFLAFGLAGLVVMFTPAIFGLRTQRRDVRTPTGRAWLAWFAAVILGGASGFTIAALVAL